MTIKDLIDNNFSRFVIMKETIKSETGIPTANLLFGNLAIKSNRYPKHSLVLNGLINNSTGILSVTLCTKNLTVINNRDVTL